MITPMIIKFGKGRVKRFHEKLGYHFSMFNTFLSKLGAHL